MIPSIRSELSKIFTARSSLVLCLVAVGLVYLIAIPSGLFGNYNHTASPGQDFSDLGDISCFFVMFLGVLSIGGEFRHGSIAPTLLVTPSRTRLLAAKLVALVIVSIVIAALAVAGSILIAAVTLPTQGYKLNLSGTEIIDNLLVIAGVAPLYVIIGLGTGTLLKNQTGAIIGLLVWIFIVDGLITVAFHAYGPYGLGAALASAAGNSSVDNPLSQAAGFLVSGGYAAALLAGGWFVLRRSDITG